MRWLLASVHRGDVFTKVFPAVLILAVWISALIYAFTWLVSWIDVYTELERWDLVLAFLDQLFLLGIVYVLLRITLLRADHLKAIPAGDYVPLRATALFLRWQGEISLILALRAGGHALLQPSEPIWLQGTFEGLGQTSMAGTLAPLVKGGSLTFGGGYQFLGFLLFAILYGLATAIDAYLAIETNTRRSWSEAEKSHGEVAGRGFELRSHAAKSVPTMLVLTLLLLASVPVSGQDRSVERAESAMATGNVAEAKQIAESALRANPRNPNLHLMLGRVRLAEGNLGEAEKSLDFALALDGNLREEVARAYFQAITRRLSVGDLDLADEFLKRAVYHEPNIKGEGIGLLYADAIKRLRLDDPLGKVMLDRWLSAYPGYSNDSEDFLFYIAQYFEVEGKRAWARVHYEKCAGLYPDGDLGKQAAQILRPRVLRVNTIRNAPCNNGRLFTTLERLEFSYETTKAVLSWFWSSENRRDLEIRVRSGTKLIGNSGREYAVDFQQHERVLVEQDVTLRSDVGLKFALFFPAVERNELSVTLALLNSRCGETEQRWGSEHEFRFADILLNWSESTEAGLPEPIADGNSIQTGEPMQGAAPGRGYEVSVVHIHDYFLATGTCLGRLRFEHDRIVFDSGNHAFELACADVFSVLVGSKGIWITQADLESVSTVKIEGRMTNKKGKPVAKTWHFLAQDQTPPTLIVGQNLCRSH
jgi:tetratricopeptide (TPR) repeat protein